MKHQAGKVTGRQSADQQCMKKAAKGLLTILGGQKDMVGDNGFEPLTSSM